MATVSINYVIEAIEENNLTFWKILDGKSILAIQDDESADASTSVALLKRKIKGINAPFVTVILSPRSFASKAKGGDTTNHEYKVLLNGNDTPVEGRAIVNIEGTAEVAKLRKENEALRTELIEQKYQKQVEALEAKFEAYKKEKDEDIGGLDKYIMQLLPSLLSNGAAPKPAINGIGESTTWVSLIERWEAADPDAGELMEKIVLLAENQKIIYNGAKAQLLTL
jgi:hypothetical protein